MYERLNHLFKKDTVRTFLIYLGAALVVNFDRFILGSYAMVKTHDQFDSYWPLQKALAERIVHFQMPGWFPDFAGGIPFFIWDVNWMFFPMIIHGLFPDPWSITIITVIQFLLAGFGMHLFLQHFFHTDERICLLGGLLWALSTFSLTYWRISDLSLIPMLFYCIDKICVTTDRRQRLLMVMGLLLCAMHIWLIKGGPFVALFHLFFIFAVYGLRPLPVKMLTAYTLFWTYVGLLNLPMIVSLLKNATHSSRNLIQWTPFDASFERFMDALFWFVYNFPHQSFVNLGIVASILTFSGFFYFRGWPPLINRLFYYYMTVLFFSQFILNSSWFISFWMSLPISGFRLHKIVLIAPLVMFLVAIVNVNKFIYTFRKTPWKIILLTTVSVAVVITYQMKKNAFPSTVIESLVVLLSATAVILGLWLLRRRGAGRKSYIILLIILIFCERLVQINLSRPADYQPPSFTHFYSSELYDQFRPAHKYDYRIAFINWHPVAGVYNGHQVAGGIGQYSKRYYYFWDTLITGEDDSKAFHDYYHMAYLYADKVKREASPAYRIRQPGFSTELLALHNVRYIFSFNEIENPGWWGLSMVHEGTPPERQPGLKRGVQVFKRIFNPIPYYVYEINQCLPRAFVSRSFDLVEGKESLKEHLRNNGINTLKDKVVYDMNDLSPADLGLLMTVQKTIPKNDNREGKEGFPLQVVYYSDNKIIINVTSPFPQQLVLNENYFRDWTATINGHPAPILPAYGVFRSVILEKGDNQVVFEYKPSYLVKSLWISGLGSIFSLIACVCWAVAGTRRKK